MTILKDRGTRQLECDECPNTTDTYDADDFHIMIQAAKEGGWQVKLGPGGEYTHLCPDCRHGDRLAAARAKFGV